MRDCRNYAFKDSPSINLLFVECRYLDIAPVSASGGELETSLDQYVTRPMSMCATVLLSWVKDEMQPLVGLEVLSATPKVYTSEADMPLWAVEEPDSNRKPNEYSCYGSRQHRIS
ncbi:hypothetical protein B0O99DRAFT_636258 [Bisporella sp. PMI_857]|nr:hypothetical protein B0O99DRAFT_636258 [Bisporella sp. PMI_857]